MKIVVLDGYCLNPGDLDWDGFREFGQVTVYDRTPHTDPEECVRRMAGAEIVLDNKVPLTAEILHRCPSLRYIGMLSTGYNVVNLQAARALGIPVTNIPSYGTAAVSQFAIAMLLAICSGVAEHSQAVHGGQWERCPDFCFWNRPLIELDGMTMGILGLGKIGIATARVAAALGMRVLACSPRHTPEGEAAAEYVSFETLLRESDVLSLHCPLFPETAGIINRETLARMKDGAILLNNSRGGLLVERDVADALNSGKLRAAAVDVASTEPILPDNPLLTAKNCYITPHISWVPTRTRRRLMDLAVENLRAYLAGTPVHVVNP